jgi:ribosomal protein S18 acetylase RimI-like enzyme
MGSELTIAPAQPQERAPAFRLIFQHVEDHDERELRVANALNLVARGELDPAGVIVARGGCRVVGALVCLPVAGASGLVWPPQVEAGPEEWALEDELIQYALAWLRQRGAKLIQTLLAPDDAHLGVPLERNGFVHVTSLWYLRRGLNDQYPMAALPGELTCLPYRGHDRELFHATLMRTYEQTQDCPELNGLRSLEEIIAGHRAQGWHDPDRWWVALRQGRPAGVLLLTEMPDAPAWDISYVGVVPEERGRGVGRALTCKALHEARAGGATCLTLSVDSRNRPAWNLYESLDFRPHDRREVFLAIRRPETGP